MGCQLRHSHVARLAAERGRTGKQVRDILFATDVAEAFHAFYEKQVPGIYNIGGSSPNAISLLECIELIGEIVGRKPAVSLGDSRHGDLQYFICDSRKALQQLNWRAAVRPREGVTRLIEWVTTNLDLFKQPAPQEV